MKNLLQRPLGTITVTFLRSLIERAYYERMLTAPAGSGNAIIDTLNTDILEIERHCAKRERYDLASACRDANIEIALQRVLPMGV
tara:strand:+ start:313 stop:567 length:255 start_codon:yes stop_codon:yes gene_type:complete